ncbi:MAG: MMPL family transporter, partial [Planctomycetota bacterium]
MARSPISSIAAWAVSRPRLALTLALGLCITLSFGALGARLSTDVSSLLPDDHPTLARFHRLQALFGASDRMVLVVEDSRPLPDDPSTAASQRQQRAALIAELADAVSTWNWTAPDGSSSAMIDAIDGRHDPDLHRQRQHAVLAHTWLLLDDQHLKQVLRRLDPRLIGKRLTSPAATVPASMQARDPLGLWTTCYLPWWQERRSDDSPLTLDQGMLVSRDDRMHVLMCHATRQSQELSFTRDLVERVLDLSSQVAADPRWSGLNLRAIGGYFIAYRDYREAQTSTWMTLVTSLAGVLLLFALAYRSLRLAGLIAVCLVPAIGASLGLTSWLLAGDLSMIASTFA